MRDWLVIGCSPYGEDCIQVRRDDNYLEPMRKELNRFKAGLKQYFSEQLKEAPGLSLSVKWEAHDFGRYGEVVARFEDDNTKMIEVAYLMEGNIPETWEELENTKYQKGLPMGAEVEYPD